MKAESWLVVRATYKSGVPVSAKVVAVRQTRPALAADEMSVRISMLIEPRAFNPEPIALSEIVDEENSARAIVNVEIEESFGEPL